MDLEVFLDKNQLLNFVNEKLLESSYFLSRWLVIKDFISVQTIPQPFQLHLRIKWSIQYLPFLKRNSNFKLILEEGLIPKVFRKGNQITIQGWKSILNDLISREIRSLNHTRLDIWPDLYEVGIYFRQVQFQNKSLRISLIISGHLAIELSPETFPIFRSNRVDFQFTNQNGKRPFSLLINICIFNSTLRRLSGLILTQKSTYMGFTLEKVLLKLNEGQLHIITHVKHPFDGFTKTSCGVVLDKKTGRLNLIDVKSKLESNNILAHLAHFSFKNSLHLLIVNQLERIMNLKIKETVIKQMWKIGKLNGVTIEYTQIEIEDNVLKLTLNINGEMMVYPKLFGKSH